MKRKILHKTKLIVRAIYNRVSKANIVCALPRSLIGVDIKRIPIVAWSSAFSRAFSRFPVLIMSSDWLTMMFSSLQLHVLIWFWFINSQLKTALIRILFWNDHMAFLSKSSNLLFIEHLSVLLITVVVSFL